MPATADAWVRALVDDGSFVSGSGRAGHRQPAEEDHGGLITGTGRIAGRPVVVWAGRAAHAPDRLAATLREAGRIGHLVVGVELGGGDGDPPPGRAGELGPFHQAQVAVRGVVPQVLILAAHLVGSAALTVALADLVVAVDGAGAQLSTNEAIEVTSGTPWDSTNQGHLAAAGLVHGVVSAPDEAIAWVKRILGLWTDRHEPPTDPRDAADEPRLAELAPTTPHQLQDQREVLALLLDDELIELQPSYGWGLICGLGRLGGRVIGVIATQPLEMGGSLDRAACAKAARLVGLCAAFSIPVLTVVDTEGFVARPEEERAGILTAAADLLAAQARADVPRLTLITGTVDSAAYATLASGPQEVLAWPGARIEATAASTLVGRLVDAVIDPAATRSALIGWLNGPPTPTAEPSTGWDDRGVSRPQTPAPSTERPAWQILGQPSESEVVAVTTVLSALTASNPAPHIPTGGHRSTQPSGQAGWVAAWRRATDHAVIR